MQTELLRLRTANIGQTCAGFRLVKKEYVPSKHADLYTLRHEKTQAELLYFDRADENKTFAIAFKTLPEDDTGVFHILEHSVLNGSRRFPVREPFVNLLQSSMQTFLNAMTFPDKTVYPVSSRNDRDFHNLMEVYLDAVFCPAIYEKPQIFMQEGWHYEFDSEDAQPYYNGVVYSEMKGAFSNVDELMETESMRLLFPDNCYGFVSGGHPESIPKLTYEQFIAGHKRFYHPSNSRIFLDGKMDIDEILHYIDAEYLSKYDYRAPDFDFTVQKQVVGEKTVSYSVKPGEEAKAHMVFSKLLCAHDEPEKVLAANVHSANIPSMVITMGGQGAVYARANGGSGIVPAKKVDVLDTTGAGDAFFAGTVIGQTYGKTLAESCEIGSRLAASVICITENVCPRFRPLEFGLDVPVVD